MIKNCEFVVLVILGLSGYSLCQHQWIRDPEHPDENLLTYGGKPMNANTKCDESHNSYMYEYKWECYTHCLYTGHGTGWCHKNNENKLECKCSLDDKRFQKRSYMEKLKSGLGEQADDPQDNGGMTQQEDDGDLDDVDDGGLYDQYSEEDEDEKSEDEGNEDESDEDEGDEDEGDEYEGDEYEGDEDEEDEDEGDEDEDEELEKMHPGPPPK